MFSLRPPLPRVMAPALVLALALALALVALPRRGAEARDGPGRYTKPPPAPPSPPGCGPYNEEAGLYEFQMTGKADATPR